MTAPELSQRERAIVARFEAAEYPAEVAYVRRLITEAVAAELRAAAEVIPTRSLGWMGDVSNPDEVRAYLRARADELGPS